MSEIYTTEDFIFSKLYKCVHVPGKMVMQDIAKAMYADPGMNTQNGTLSLRDYCTQKGIRPEDHFHGDNASFLDCDLMNEDFDISFAYLLMKEVCDALCSKLRCQQKIVDLKNLRNRINHCYSDAEDNMKETCRKLKAIIEDIYVDGSSVLNRNFDAEASRTLQIFEDIIAAEIQTDNMDVSHDIEKFKNDNLFKMIHHGRRELGERLDNWKILNPFIVLLNDDHKVEHFRVEKIFTPLEIEDRMGNIDVNEILTVTVKVEKILPRVLLFHGVSGCGKTSLCRHLFDRWLMKNSDIQGLDEFDLVFLVEVRTVRSDTVLEYLSEQLMQETCGYFKREDIPFLLSELRLLFIIDGFDEKTDRASKLVKDIFQNFNDHRIIITTRHEKLKDAITLAKTHNVEFLCIKVCGFSDDKVEEFSRKLFGEIMDESERDRELNKFLKYIDGPGRVLDEHLRLPLTISLLIILWKHDSKIVNNVTTLTRLYQEIFGLSKERLARRMANRGALPFKALKRVLSEMLLLLGEQAWSMLQKDEYTLNEENLKKINEMCRSKKIENPEDILSAFLMCETDKNSRMKNYVFKFFHKSQMEYFAARWLGECISQERSLKNVANQHESWIKYREVIKYITGELASKKHLKDKIDDLFSLIDKADIENLDYNFWWNIINECNPIIRVNEDIFEHVKHDQVNNRIGEQKINLRDWDLNHENVVSALKLLCCTPVNPSSLKIDIMGSKNPHKIPMFLDTMNGESLKKLSRKIDVNLALSCHGRYDCQDTSDAFIDALKPWANLTHFIGGLKEPKNFWDYTNLRTIDVRVITVEALETLKKIRKSVRTLRLKLQLSPEECPAKLLPDLQYTGNLEISLDNMEDKHKNWILDVVKQLAGSKGCWRLVIHFSTVTRKDLEWLLRRLSKGVLYDKLTIRSNISITEEDKEVLNKEAKFDIVWLD
ncbi:hypothetical protein OTU49_001785 [Cherax quadricarinatus]|uniref:NACHT domain-containing protein n=1 Tax=Cherax quadricarinatus TaxID=27406 RepID=A0AAW0XD47_CHEQU